MHMSIGTYICRLGEYNVYFVKMYISILTFTVAAIEMAHRTKITFLLIYVASAKFIDSIEQQSIQIHYVHIIFSSAVARGNRNGTLSIFLKTKVIYFA